MLERPDLRHLRQGDILADQHVLWLPDPDFHVVTLDEDDKPVRWQRLSEGGATLFASRRTQWCCVMGERTPAMLLSQTCDIVQPTKPTVLLAPVRPLASLPEDLRGYARSNRLPWALCLPGTAAATAEFADLRFMSTVDKLVLANCRRLRSLTPALADKLTQALTAWFARPALPDDLVLALRPFLERVKGWSRASQDKVYAIYVRQDGSRVQILAVMDVPDDQVQGAIRQAVRSAAERAPHLRIDVRFGDVERTTLAGLRGFVRLDLGYLSYPD